MPSKSEKQQRFMQAVLAYKKGKLKNPTKKLIDASESMSEATVHDFADKRASLDRDLLVAGVRWLVSR